MKRLSTILSLFLLSCTFSSHAQIFWVENFGTSSTTGLATAYTGPNGAWTETAITSGGNKWYVSCQEQGYVTGTCGADCTGPAGLASTLHVSASFGDLGAAYNAGSATNKRIESPTINCSGHTGITLSFYYIENGEGAIDDATVYYSPDGGTTWSLLGNPPKTIVCGSGQGQWDHYSVALPSSANNNANVKIGFLWVNNGSAGTDPSFAVDSMSLSTTSTTSTFDASFTTSSATICEDSCITVTSTSTGTIDSVHWTVPGATVSSATATPATICFPSSGTFTVHLYAHSGTNVDSASTIITVNRAPHPMVASSGTTLTVSGTVATYQWYKNDTAIAGATNATYDYTGAYGSYYVIADSGGCKGMSNAIIHTVGVAQVSLNGALYSIAQSGADVFTLYSSLALTADMMVQVYDATGRQIMRDQWHAGSDNSQYRVAGLPWGIYIVRIGNADNSAVLKWLKQ